jgi:hypothetical protein
MARIFEQVAKGKLASGAKSIAQQAAKWFTGNIKNLIKIRNTIQIFNMFEGKMENKLSQDSLGHLYMFVYDAKWKADTKKLPYYDQFPIIFPIGFTKDGFYGLNLHYLPPRLRAILMSSIYEAVQDKNAETGGRKKKPDVTMVLDAFGRHSLYKPCIKRYIYDKHVRSKFIRIPVDQWDYALMLETERFVTGAQDKPYDKRKVWADSVNK